MYPIKLHAVRLSIMKEKYQKLVYLIEDKLIKYHCIMQLGQKEVTNWAVKLEMCCIENLMSLKMLLRRY